MDSYDLYYKGIYLGTLFEDGVFTYTIDSKYSDRFDMELVAHQLSLIEQVAKEPNFNYEKYVKAFNEFKFNNGYKFVKSL